MTHALPSKLSLPILAAVGVLLAGPADLRAQDVAAKRGAEIVARWCTDCHATGQGARASDVGPSFPEIAENRSADYIRGFLANPHVRGLMPPFDMPRQHIEDVVAYLQSLKQGR